MWKKQDGLQFEPAPEDPAGNRWAAFFIRALLGFVILMIVALFFLGKQKKEELEAARAGAVAVERPPVNVVVMELKPGLIRDRLNLPAMVEPWVDLHLLAKIGGEVVEVLATEGDRVSRGDVLAKVDETDYRIAVEAAEASYQQASAALKRSQGLRKQKLISEAEFEEVETRVRLGKADLERARLQLSRCRIEAPISGVVHSLDVEKGTILNVADPVGRILRLDRVKAVVGIPESDVAAARRIEQIEVTIRALDDLRVIGAKHYLASAPESQALLYRLEVALDNADGAILPGMFARAEIVKREEVGLAVPLYAVIARDAGQFVYVEENGVAARKEVRLGIIEEWMVQVVEGLTPGSRVLVEGHRNVENGQRVEVVKEVSVGPQGVLL